jgi:ABC-type dipeptide/oligopeptide/nickel transport system permease component
MLQYAIRRVLWTIPVILVCTTLLFGLMRVGGGNFLRHPPPAGLSNVGWVKYGDPKPESITRNIERRLGLDLPWYDQYFHYLGSVAQLDFDPSRCNSPCSRSAGRSPSAFPWAWRRGSAAAACSTARSRP